MNRFLFSLKRIQILESLFSLLRKDSPTRLTIQSHCLLIFHFIVINTLFRFVHHSSCFNWYIILLIAPTIIGIISVYYKNRKVTFVVTRDRIIRKYNSMWADRQSTHSLILFPDPWLSFACSGGAWVELSPRKYESISARLRIGLNVLIGIRLFLLVAVSFFITPPIYKYILPFLRNTCCVTVVFDVFPLNKIVASIDALRWRWQNWLISCLVSSVPLIPANKQIFFLYDERCCKTYSSRSTKIRWIKYE